MTARSKVFDPHSKNGAAGRTLFDSGSMRSYITEELRNILSLPTLRKERLIFNTFGKRR